MEDQHNINELINQAISCDLPYGYGTVNLNRLREVLLHLVSTRRQDAKPLHSNEQIESENESTKLQQNQSSVVRKPDDALVVVVGSSGSLPDDSPCSSIVLEDEKESAAASEQNLLSKISEISQKVNEINANMLKIEAKVSQLEQNHISKGEGKTESNHDQSMENGGVSLSDDSAERNEDEIRLENNAEDENQQLSGTSKSLVTNSQELDEHTMELTEADASTSTSKNNRSSSTHPAGCKDHTDAEDVNYVDVDQTNELLESQSDGKVMENTLWDKLNQLSITVNGLVEREQVFSERQIQAEQMMSSHIDELYRRYKSPSYWKDDNIPNSQLSKDQLSQLPNEQAEANVVAPGAEDTPIKREDPHGNGKLCALLEVKVLSMVGEISERMLALERKLNTSSIKTTAGGKLREGTINEVQCISCDGRAQMNIKEAFVPEPIPFHVNRCVKPFLRRQLYLLQKELKCSTVIPVNMELYHQLLKQKPDH